MSQVVVLCGGLGTRMLPASEHTPKVLLEVAGRPFLDHLIHRFVAAGFEEVLLLVGHLADAIERHVRTRQLPILVRLAHDPPGPPRGTGRALVGALDRLREDFVLTYGDAWPSVDHAAPLAALRADPTALGCMLVTPIDAAPTAADRANACVAEGRVTRYEKGCADPRLDHLDAGVLALRRRALLGRDGLLDLADLQGELARRDELLAQRTRQPTFEIGSPEGLAALEGALVAVERRA
jgi:N-acetyl-alpha-D-muramate 1-phosphate uridylyltransferase